MVDQNNPSKPRKPKSQKFNDKTVKQVDVNLFFNFDKYHPDENLQKKTQKMHPVSKQNDEGSGEEAILFKRHDIDSVKFKSKLTPKLENEFKAKSYPLFECSNRFDILEDEEVDSVENKKMTKLVERKIYRRKCLLRDV